MLEPFSCQQTVNRSRSNLIVKNAVNIVINKCSFTYIWKQVNKFGDLVQPLPPDYLEITTCRPPRIGSILVSASYFKRQPGTFTARVQRLNSLPLFLVVTLGTWFPVSSSPIYKKKKKHVKRPLMASWSCTIARNEYMYYKTTVAWLGAFIYLLKFGGCILGLCFSGEPL